MIVGTKNFFVSYKGIEISITKYEIILLDYFNLIF